MKSRRQTFTGRVISDRMDKTVVVEVEALRAHRLYGKVLRRRKRFKAHDEGSGAGIGDLVRIEETRPLSKEVRWRVVEVTTKSRGAEVPVAPAQSGKAEHDDPELHQA